MLIFMLLSEIKSLKPNTVKERTFLLQNKMGEISGAEQETVDWT